MYEKKRKRREEKETEEEKEKGKEKGKRTRDKIEQIYKERELLTPFFQEFMNRYKALCVKQKENSATATATFWKLLDEALAEYVCRREERNTGVGRESREDRREQIE
jgi:hypothetical protein